MANYTLGLWANTGLDYGTFIGDGFTFSQLTNSAHTVVASDDDAILNDWTSGSYNGTATAAAYDGDTTSVVVSSDIPGFNPGEMVTSGRWFELQYTDPTTGLTETLDAFLLWDDTSDTDYVSGGSTTYVFATEPFLDGVTYWVVGIDENAGVPWSALAPLCLAGGTLVATPDGQRRVEELRVGDLVLTQDHGPQKVRWLASHSLEARELRIRPKYRPIKISAGVLGEGLPERDLLVSPQHRIMVRSKIAQRLFGTAEVLVPAIKLTGVQGVEQTQGEQGVIYWHVLFDQHQIIFAEGAPTESLFVGVQALSGLPQGAREEIEMLFPEIVNSDFKPSLVRLVPDSGRQVKELLRRHQKNHMPILSTMPT